MSKTHSVKIWPEYFNAVCNLTKKHEIRRDDRDYQVGDLVILREWNHTTEEFTGKEQGVEITYVSRGFTGIEPGYVVFSFRVIP